MGQNHGHRRRPHAPLPMELFALLVSIAALAACTGGAWLAIRTWRFATGPDYTLFHGWSQAGDGLGIFVPSMLLVGLGLFLAQFARKLWRD